MSEWATLLELIAEVNAGTEGAREVLADWRADHPGPLTLPGLPSGLASTKSSVLVTSDALLKRLRKLEPEHPWDRAELGWWIGYVKMNGGMPASGHDFLNRLEGDSSGT